METLRSQESVKGKGTVSKVVAPAILAIAGMVATASAGCSDRATEKDMMDLREAQHARDKAARQLQRSREQLGLQYKDKDPEVVREELEEAKAKVEEAKRTGDSLDVEIAQDELARIKQLCKYTHEGYKEQFDVYPAWKCE